jgi:PHP domain
MASPPVGFDVSCVVHVHSTYSDGTATVPELLAAASAAGADAVLLTDHDTLGARRDGREGMHGGVFLLVGVEISPRHGHYLAFGVDEEVPHAGRTAGEIAAAVRAAGGVGFAAHPFSTGGHMVRPSLARRIVLPHGWPALDEPGGADGVEVWSLTTDAAEGWRTPAEAWRWLRDPEAAVADGPPAHHLRRWDELSAHRRVPAIAGLDGHAPGIRVGGRVRSPLSHARTFGLLRTHLIAERALTGDVARDRATLIAGLRAGSAWVSCPFVAPVESPRLWAERDDGGTVPMGGECRAQPAVLRLRLARAADIRVLRDGSPWHAAHGDRLDLALEGPGGYRVEARIGGRLWLLSNPIHLRCGHPARSASPAPAATRGRRGS